MQTFDYIPIGLRGRFIHALHRLFGAMGFRFSQRLRLLGWLGPVRVRWVACGRLRVLHGERIVYDQRPSHYK